MLNRKVNLRLWIFLLPLFALLVSPLKASQPEDFNLVNLKSVIPDLEIDMPYTTPNNFTGKIVYNFNECYLLEEAAYQLREVQEELKQSGLKLKVWDGFRPMSAQWKFWELVPDERYVTDPRKGGRHTRGTAVDLTLVTLDGQELEMPTAFDDFTEKAHRSCLECTNEAIQNRQILETVMLKHGFLPFPSEWWHFDYQGWENYPPIDYNP